MIISDLNHLEVVNEESSILGGTKKLELPKYVVVFVKPALVTPKATADAEADANAVGRVTSTNTSTIANAVAGQFSTSGSGSSAKASGAPVSSH